MEDISRRCTDGKRHDWVFHVAAYYKDSCFKCFKCGKKKSDWVKERPQSIMLSTIKSDNELIRVFLDTLSLRDISPLCERAGLNKNRVYEALLRRVRTGVLK